MNPEHESGNSIGVASTALNGFELLKRFLIKKNIRKFFYRKILKIHVLEFFCVHIVAIPAQ